MAFGIATVGNINNSGNTLNITCPTHIGGVPLAAGDGLILTATVSSSSRTMSWPTGFVEFTSFANVPGYQTRVAKKPSDGTEGGTALAITVSGGPLKKSGICAAISGCDPTDPVADFAVMSEATVDTDKTLPALAAPAGSMHMSIIGNARGDGIPQIAAYTAPSPLTKQVEAFTDVLAANSTALAVDLTPADMNFGPDAWTYDQSASGGGFTIAIAPAAGGEVTLDGISPAASSATGALAASRPLTGSSPAASGGTGSLSATRSLTGTAPAASGATADLASTRALTGTSSAADGATGALAAERALSGSASSASSAIGDLTVSRDVLLDGTAPNAATATGVLTLGRPLTGTAPVASGLTGTLILERPLTGTAASAAMIEGVASVERALAATVASASFATGDLTVTGQMPPHPQVLTLTAVPDTRTLTAIPATLTLTALEID